VRLDREVPGLPSDAVALVGFSFASDGSTSEEWTGFPAAEVVVPQITIVRERGRSRLVVAVPPGSDPAGVLAALATLRPAREPRLKRDGDVAIESIPPPEVWREQVDEAIASIRAGGLDKVVLARSLRLGAGSRIGGFDVVAMLRDRYPRARVFGWQAGDAVFVGASPELLVQRHGERFEALPLAGSAPRGRTPAEDRKLGDDLLASAKDRTEHALVVEAVARRLIPLAHALDVAGEPHLERFSTVQHLATTVTGTGPARLLHLVDALHPTPAVGGSPTAEALAFISKVEEIDRGWYAGGLGWLDAHGDGEVAVALRCGLVRDDVLLAFAGNGIVADSDPRSEVAETRLKFRPLLDLLVGEADG
jgi:isochorismate synthase